ncbi:MAG: sensor histidine kinase [Clostridiales bacterium]|nr:sensor histidine kinase [Clostridiales bacterium]
MQSDSKEVQFMWYAAMLALTVQGVCSAVAGRIYPAVLLFSLGLVTLNLSFYLKDTPKKLFSILLLLFEIGAIVILPRWYIGALALLVIPLNWYLHPRLLHVFGASFSLGGLLCHLLVIRPSAISTLPIIGASLLCFILWEIALSVLFNLLATQGKLNRALTAAAVDAMEQRNLREELAKNQKVNEKNARLAERERISRDIHNYVGHTLSAATVTLDAATLLVPNDQEKALEKIDVANSRVHEAISSVRSVVRTLDAEDDCIIASDYLSALEKRIDEFKMDTSIRVYHNFSQIQSKERIPIQTASFLSSALSELLTNGVRHGKADLFVITFVLDPHHIRMKVQDNGTGFGKISLNEKKLRLNNGFGLRKIRDYAESCGGNFEIESEDGFTVSLSLPFEGETNDKNTAG